jgi:hypothetical protein
MSDPPSGALGSVEASPRCGEGIAIGSTWRKTHAVKPIAADPAKAKAKAAEMDHPAPTRTTLSAGGNASQED